MGWQLRNVVAALKEKPKEVKLAVRKHPRSTSTHNLIQKKQNPKTALTLGDDLKQSTFPKVCIDRGVI